MIPFSLHEIAFILHAQHIGMDTLIDTISIDSNAIGKRCMFVALIGKHFDGHDFAEQSVISGAQALLVNHYLPIDVPQLIVIDTHDALIKIAHWVRCQVSSKIIAITGSSGKTSVKEMTASILRSCGKVIATKKNFNNIIGVSITLLDLDNENDFAVIELGTSKTGEINQLSKVIAADVAIVNNIFPSHLSGFGSLTAIKKEKGEVFRGLPNHGQAVINADNHAFSTWYSVLKEKSIWRFSLKKKIDSDFFASNIIFNTNGTQFVLNSPYGTASVFLSLLGRHNVANALAASALAFSVGANLSEIVFGLQSIKALPGRLFPIILNEGKLLLLDDTYNSNIGSMIAAIYVLNRMPGYRILVVSDMLELGMFKSIEYHCYLGNILAQTTIEQVVTLGHTSYFLSQSSKKGKHFQDKNKLIVYLNNILFRNQCVSVLVKGSRDFHMEQVIHAIQDKSKCYSG